MTLIIQLNEFVDLILNHKEIPCQFIDMATLCLQHCRYTLWWQWVTCCPCSMYTRLLVLIPCAYCSCAWSHSCQSCFIVYISSMHDYLAVYFDLSVHNTLVPCIYMTACLDAPMHRASVHDYIAANLDSSVYSASMHDYAVYFDLSVHNALVPIYTVNLVPYITLFILIPLCIRSLCMIT